MRSIVVAIALAVAAVVVAKEPTTNYETIVPENQSLDTISPENKNSAAAAPADKVNPAVASKQQPAHATPIAAKASTKDSAHLQATMLEYGYGTSDAAALKAAGIDPKTIPSPPPQSTVTVVEKTNSLTVTVQRS